MQPLLALAGLPVTQRAPLPLVEYFNRIPQLLKLRPSAPSLGRREGRTRIEAG